MDFPLLGPKPKSALPSYLINGTSPLHTSSDIRERENLAASINASSGRRQPVDLDGSQLPTSNGDANILQHAVKPRLARPGVHSGVTEAARDPRDEAPPPTPPSSSRPASPYTLNPPIDFDGLSWPSECENIDSLASTLLSSLDP